MRFVDSLNELVKSKDISEDLDVRYLFKIFAFFEAIKRVMII